VAKNCKAEQRARWDDSVVCGRGDKKSNQAICKKNRLSPMGSAKRAIKCHGLQDKKIKRLVKGAEKRVPRSLKKQTNSALKKRGRDPGSDKV